MRFVVLLINRSVVSYQHQELCLCYRFRGWRRVAAGGGGGGGLTLAVPEIIPH